jgi:hypothetical protein
LTARGIDQERGANRGRVDRPDENAFHAGRSSGPKQGHRAAGGIPLSKNAAWPPASARLPVMGKPSLESRWNWPQLDPYKTQPPNGVQ